MKLFSAVLSITFLFLFSIANAQDEQKIRHTLDEWNKAIMSKDLAAALGVFDQHANVILAGSEENEIHRGNAAIKLFLESFFAKPLTLSWDMRNAQVEQNKNTAWIFVDGSATVKQKNGSTATTPYRITVVMIKKGSEWKWRLFNGSVPEKQNK